MNVVPGQLYTPANQIDLVNGMRRKKGIIEYLMSHCPDLTERQAVVDSISINLKHLNVVIRREDLMPLITQVNCIQAVLLDYDYRPHQRPMIPERRAVPAPQPAVQRPMFIPERRGIPVGPPGAPLPPRPPPQRPHKECVFL